MGTPECRCAPRKGPGWIFWLTGGWGTPKPGPGRLFAVGVAASNQKGRVREVAPGLLSCGRPRRRRRRSCAGTVIASVRGGSRSPVPSRASSVPLVRWYCHSSSLAGLSLQGAAMLRTEVGASLLGRGGFHRFVGAGLNGGKWLS
eukprot:8820496-Pyramimonas_sp.AAC.1